MKKKIFFVVGLLIISSFATIGFINNAKADSDNISIDIDFNEPNTKNINIDGANFLKISSMSGTNSMNTISGAPILPQYKKTYKLPFGSTITDVQIQTDDVQTKNVQYKIVPSPKPAIPGIDDEIEPEYFMDPEIYNINQKYPDNWYSINTGAGIDESGEHVTFLNVLIEPVKYNPIQDELSYVTNLEMTISYDIPPDDPFPANGDYDMVIIAPSSFSNDLQKLIDHKNSYGIDTFLKTTDEIYSEYNGFDKAEEIKLFIKDAIESEGIKYVLLVGGMKSYITGNSRDNRNIGVSNWHVPVRYTNLKEMGTTYDPGYISDLYYADIYNSDGSFSSWDSDRNGNSDGLYANWQFTAARDYIDHFPDVIVGRLACRNKIEVKIMVNKIINYESTPAGSWYNRMIGIGGDSHDDSGTNYDEGEVACDDIFSRFMSEYTPIKLYSTNRYSNSDNIPSSEAIIREVSAGAGHLLFDGHGNPGSWNTHWHGEFTWADTPGGIQIFEFPKLRNKNKLPVAVVGGCHNSQFNVSLIPTLRGDKYMWTYGAPVPECFSWWLARKINGGSIAAFGNTGLGYGRVGENGDIDGDGMNLPDTIEKLGGYQIWLFYKTIDEGVEYLGDAWAGAETKYMNTYNCTKDQTDAKTVQQWPLLGDPSLKLGGYDTTKAMQAVIVDGESGIVAKTSEAIQLEGSTNGGSGTYTYTWDLDNDGNYDDKEGKTISYQWNNPGAYWISLKVEGTAETSTFDTIVHVEYQYSETDKPLGAGSVDRNTIYTFITGIDADDWDNIYYQFQWGDGTLSEWQASTSASHKWSDKGTYQIRARALLISDIMGAEAITITDWSDFHSIKVSGSNLNIEPQNPMPGHLYSKFTGEYGMNLKFLLGDLSVYLMRDLIVEIEASGADMVKFIVEDQIGNIVDSAEVTSTNNIFSYNFGKIGIGIFKITSEAYMDDELEDVYDIGDIFSISI